MSRDIKDSGITLGQLLCTVRQKLRQASVDRLEPQSGIAIADLEARILVQWATDCSLSTLISSPEQLVSIEVEDTLQAAVKRRINGEPVYRIIGQREFYGLQFCLNTDTLEPRPDTETLVDAVLPFLQQAVARNEVADLLDMGTGTGAIAVSLLHEVKEARAVGVDIAAGALEMARLNAANAGVSSRFAALQSDWFEAVTGRFDIIVSNPPYIPFEEVGRLADEVRYFDPFIALDGGADGLNFYRSLAKHAGQYLSDKGVVAVEIGAGQGSDIIAIFAEYSLQLIDAADDLGGHQRVLIFQF